MHGLVDCTYSMLHCSYSRQFAEICKNSIFCCCSFFLTGNMPIKQKACTFFINFFHIKLGFVCHAASIEDVSSLGSIVCFLILTTFLFCFCL